MLALETDSNPTFIPISEVVVLRERGTFNTIGVLVESKDGGPVKMYTAISARKCGKPPNNFRRGWKPPVPITMAQTPAMKSVDTISNLHLLTDYLYTDVRSKEAAIALQADETNWMHRPYVMRLADCR